MITRQFVNTLESRMKEQEPLIQVVLGPRQVGKTTGVKKLLENTKRRSHYASADDTLNTSNKWIQEQWQTALEKGPGTLLVIDEIQKIPNWSEIIKRLWDGQKAGNKLKIILLGSSSLSLQKGLTESLAGRFEIIPVWHWNYKESKAAFNYDLETYLRYGGYPGGNKFIGDYPRWFSYIKTSVIDNVIGLDILSLQTVSKPALFRQAFEILCHYPGHEISYTSLLGQLQDKGNTDLIKHYVELYEGAFLFRTLSKYAKRAITVKGSSPKIIPMCPALFTLAAGAEALENPETKGHVFEALTGMDLAQIPMTKLYYWREKDYEVDFVLVQQSKVYAIEVKSGRDKSTTGLKKFQEKFPNSKSCMITFENYESFAENPLLFLEKTSVQI